MKIELTRTHFSGYSVQSRHPSRSHLFAVLPGTGPGSALLLTPTLRSHANPEIASGCTVKAAFVLLFLSELNLLLNTFKPWYYTFLQHCTYVTPKLFMDFLWGGGGEKAYIKNKQVKCRNPAPGNSKLISKCCRDGTAVGICTHFAQQKARSGSVLCRDTLQAHANLSHEHHWRDISWVHLDLPLKSEIIKSRLIYPNLTN